MRKQFLALLSGALVLALAVGVGISVAAGPPASATASLGEPASAGVSDNLETPLAKEQAARRAKALELLAKGKIPEGTKVAQIGKGRYVQLAREDTDKIFVVLVEFGNERYPLPQFQDKNAAGQPASNAQRFDGPLHNEIPQPDRKVDNSTLWQADYDRAHFVDMYFDRMAEYYETQSSGRYSVEGDVTEWVKVPFNEALYGRNYCGGIVCNTTKALVRDALAVWVKNRLDAGQTMAQIQSYLRSFDEWDRYDLDGDGNFDEPDGFIDHFQIVHAGGDEAAGDPTYGTDAIWSHRWYSNLQLHPSGLIAGVNVGSNAGLVTSSLVPNNPTGVWVGDYTIQPENGGLGVFAHEFGHDLGLPDLYDTSGNTGGAENSTAFWTLMSSGANIGDGGPDGIGDNPTDLGAWEKLQLGWLDFDVAEAGKASSHRLGPAEGTTRNGKQGLVVVLPDKSVSTPVVAPKTGDWSYWSGMGDMLDNTMTKPMTLPAGATIAADVWLDTEAHFDYAFLEVSTDNGANWTPIRTSLSLPASDDQGQFNSSGTGMAGSSGGAYLPMVTNVPLPTGNVLVRFRYRTDQNTGGKGVVFDNIQVTGQPLDGAETVIGWEFDGFSRMEKGVGMTQKFNAYIAENRGYRGLRHVAQDGLQLRLPRLEAGLGRVVPVPGRAPDQLLGLVLHEQQRRRPPGAGADPPGGRAPDVPPRAGRHSAPAADPELRLDVLEAGHQGDHGQHQQQADHDPGAEGRGHLRRHEGLLVRHGERPRDPAPRAVPAGLEQREGAEDRHDHLDQERWPAERHHGGRGRYVEVGATASRETDRAGVTPPDPVLGRCACSVDRRRDARDDRPAVASHGSREFPWRGP